MDWDQIRRQWQADRADTAGITTSQHAKFAAPQAPDLDEQRRRETRLRRQILRRDFLETGVAVLVAPVFGAIAWSVYQRGHWITLGFCIFLIVWVAYVPVRLWRTRRAMPIADPTAPLLGHLRQQSSALIVQAQMLEGIWIWYFAPCAFGVIGMYLSISGPTPGALLYALLMVLFGVVMARVNHYVARAHFRALAAHIECQLFELTNE